MRAGNKAVGRGDGFAVIVEAHIESLDLLRVIGYENGLFKYLFREISFMLCLKIYAPLDRVFKFGAGFFENIHRFRVCYASEVGGGHMA